MVYPTFTINTKAINIASSYGYSPYFDIVWSFDYAISGNSNTEAGFTIFLMDDAYVLSGGNNGIDLGYSGLSAANSNLSSINPGISGAVIAVGFDTTGSFAVSALSGSRVLRDGVLDSQRIQNSVSIRSSWPTYSYNTYKYNVALSSIDSNFKIVENTVQYKTIRARLGNVGQTLYVDYRNNPEEDFKPLVATEVNLGIISTTKYKAGVSFATPISSNNISAVGNIHLRNFHTEGSVVSGDITSLYIPITSVQLPSNLTITEPPSILPIPDIPFVITAITDNEDSLCNTTTISSLRIISTDNGTGLTEDAYNFGYQIQLSSIDRGLGVILTRESQFAYSTPLSSTLGPSPSSYTLIKSNFYDTWMLSGSRIVGTSGFSNNFTPIGKYSVSFIDTCGIPPSLTATYIC